ISGKPGPTLVVNAPKAIRGDTITGSAFAAGTLSGNIYDVSIEGRAAGDRVNVRGNSARSFKSEFVWTDARTPQAKLIVGLDADSLNWTGFEFDTLKLRLTYASPGGHVELGLVEDQRRQYSATGDYTFFPDRRQLRLTDVHLQFDTVQWRLVRPSLIAWGPPG